MPDSVHHLSIEAALAALKTDPEQGLSSAEVARRRQRFGPNRLEQARQRPAWFLLLNQFNDLLIMLLIGAAGLAFYLQDFRGGTILLAIVFINALIGAYQEFKAEKTLEMLRRLVNTQATVVRDGKQVDVDEDELVPGDMVFLEDGDAVPADVRLIEAHEFKTNDFILTGESLPQEKTAEVVADLQASLADQDNVAFFGTSVAAGNALGVVFATGGNTAIGDIAQISQTIERDSSPLQREINSLARTLTVLAGVIALMLFAANLLLRGDEFSTTQLLISNSLMFAIGVAAACVPQGLPAQISVALSLGVGRLARMNAVVKRLSAVETLGSTNVICSDKTGTITKNEMTIVNCWLGGRDLAVTGEGYEPVGEILADDQALTPAELKALEKQLACGFLASRGRTQPPDAEHPTWHATGDPTEAAFMPLAIKAGLSPEQLDADCELVDELPFDSKRKRMTMIRSYAGHPVAFMKGAPASVLECCTSLQRDGDSVPLDDAARAAVLAKAEEFSRQALRVIAIGWKDLPAAPADSEQAAVEQDFVLAGLVGMLDPPRQGVHAAVQSIRDAHIRLFMITGDDRVTAQAIAERIGMETAEILTDEELHTLSDTELKQRLSAQSLIFSRVSPADKLRIVRLLKQTGEVVAVTGDGVNDTLCLKQADIGVAMGELGSDVAKEAAEIVLVDDNFNTLAAAIREGRTIFQNLRRVIMASITSNVGELSVVILGFVGVAYGLPIPITAVQILAIDLIAEMLPLMAMTFDPPEPGVMRRSPRQLEDHIINGRSLVEVLLFGALMGLAGYFSFFMVLQTGGAPGTAQAAAYAGIAVTQFVNILSRRSSRSVFTARSLSNPYIWGALGISLVAVLVTVNVPAIAPWFGFEPLRLVDWIWPVTGAVVYLGAFEVRKFWRDRPQPTAA